MKILCVTGDLGPGGTQRQLVEIALFLCQIGYDVEFLTYRAADYYESILRQQGIRIIHVAPCGFFKRFFRMRKIIRGGSYDLVMAFRRTSAFICELAGFPFRKWKLIVSERNWHKDISRTFLGRFYPWCHRFADIVVCNTLSNRLTILKSSPKLDPAKVEVIYNCHDFKRWKRPEPVPAVTKNDTLTMVVSARDCQEANVNSFIDAMLLLSPQERTQLSIEWYGYGLSKNCSPENLEVLRNRILENQLRFSLAHAPSDMGDLLNSADIAGLFCYTERLPKFLSSAMASGKPIISSQVSDMAFLIGEGEGGFLCSAIDPVSVADALRKMIHSTPSERHAMGLHNMTKARIHFTREHTVQRYAVLIQKLIG